MELNAKYNSSNQVTSHPYFSGLQVAKNWNEKQDVIDTSSELFIAVKTYSVFLPQKCIVL
jgi:hypothetical protein